MASGTPVGRLIVKIAADTGELVSGLNRADSRVRIFGQRAAELAKRVAALGAAAIAAGAAVVAGLVRSGLQAIDAQAKLARQLGGTIDGLRGLQIAAKDAGIEQGALETATERLNARLGEATRGAGTASKALERLGLDAQVLSQMDLDERMATLADAIRDKGLSAQQAADELRQLGIRQGEMVNLMLQGGDAIRAARQEVDDFGLSVSEVDARQIERANDALGRIGRTVEGIRNQLTIALAPVLTVIADRFNNMAREARGWGEQTRLVIESALLGFGRLADVVHYLRAAKIWLNRIGAQLAVTFGEIGIRAAELLDLFGMLSRTEAFQGWVRSTEEARQRLAQVTAALEDLLAQERPSVAINRMIEDIRREAEATVAALERTSGAMFGEGGEGGALAALADKELAARLQRLREYLMDEAQLERARHQERLKDLRDAFASDLLTQQEFRDMTEELEAQHLARLDEIRQDGLAGRLQRLRDAAMSEAELEQARHEERIADLRDAWAEEMVTTEEFVHIREELERQHMERLATIRQRGLSDLERFTEASFATQAETVTRQLSAMTAGVARENKAMFALNKTFAIADAIVSTHQGVAKTLSAYPWPLAGVLAGVHAAAGLARVAAIRGQSFGSGGGTAPSVTGTTPAPAVSPVESAAPQQTTTIHIQGETFGAKQVRDLIERINEELGAGARLRVV